MPRALWSRSLTGQDVEIPVIGANLVENILRTVPLVDNLFDQVVTFVQSKPNRPFVRLEPRIAFHFELHQTCPRLSENAASSSLDRACPGAFFYLRTRRSSGRSLPGGADGSDHQQEVRCQNSAEGHGGEEGEFAAFALDHLHREHSGNQAAGHHEKNQFALRARDATQSKPAQLHGKETRDEHSPKNRQNGKDVALPGKLDNDAEQHEEERSHQETHLRVKREEFDLLARRLFPARQVSQNQPEGEDRQQPASSQRVGGGIDAQHDAESDGVTELLRGHSRPDPPPQKAGGDPHRHSDTRVAGEAREEPRELRALAFSMEEAGHGEHANHVSESRLQQQGDAHRFPGFELLQDGHDYRAAGAAKYRAEQQRRSPGKQKAPMGGSGDGAEGESVAEEGEQHTAGKML